MKNAWRLGSRAREAAGRAVFITHLTQESKTL
jgi:hypothetical protein